MKILLLLIVLGVTAYFGYQDWTREPPKAPAPTPTPATRLAPEGVLYVLQAFSVAHDEGIHGFPRGREVRLLERSGEVYVVTDGVREGRASSEHFTNDLDVLDRIRQENETLGQQLKAEAERLAEVRQREADTALSSKAEKLRKETVNELEESRRSLQHLDRRIAAAESERVSKGYPASGGPRGPTYGRKISMISSDAANITQLREQKLQLEHMISRLEARISELHSGVSR